MSNGAPPPEMNDDEATLQYLLSPHSQHSAIELRNHLSSLKSRFSESKHPFGATFWSNLASDVHHFGTLVTVKDETQASSKPTPSAQSTKQLAFLEATSEGTKHVNSLRALLQVTNEEAAHLTFAALRENSNTDNGNELSPHHQSLLGTPNLITFVREYHLRENVARLRCLTECLRIELEDEDRDEDCSAEVRSFLDYLDHQYQIRFSHENEDEVKSRGLFRMLLVSVCCGIPGNSNSSAGIFEEAALETLLVLLYGRRMSGGELTRWDLMILLMAMESKGFFCTTATTNASRMPKLVSLICAEALSLWKLTSSSPDTPCVLFQGFDNGGYVKAQNEMLSILELLRRNADTVNKRRAKQLSTVEDLTEAPEAIALLSFGLLFLLAQSHFSSLDESSVHFLSKQGMECIRSANDEFGAFAYLDWTLRTLLPTTRTKLLRRDDNGNFIPFSQDIQADDDEEGDYDDASIVVYSSIGREIITAIISAFYMSDGADISKFPVDDIQMLSSLLAISYRSQTTSCISFWNTWYKYIHKEIDMMEQDNIKSIDPLCLLVDASHRLSLSSMQIYQQDASNLLPAVAPLLKIVATLICDNEMMKFAMESIAGDKQVGGVVLLPPVILTTVITLCAELHHQHIYTVKNKTPESVDFISKVQSTLSSIASLVQTGGRYISSLIINTFEKYHGESIQLPRLLYRIASHAPNTDIARDALTILSNLLRYTTNERSASDSLHVATSQCLSIPDGFALFLSNNMTSSYQSQFQSTTVPSPHMVGIALMNILQSLSTNLGQVITSSLSQNDVEAYIKTILNGTVIACDKLVHTSSSQKSFASKESEEELELNLACMQAITNALRSIHPFLLHPDPIISDACSNARHSIIYKLAATPQLGEIISAHATLPVASALRGSLRVQAWKSQNSPLKEQRKSEKRFGEWGSIAMKIDKKGDTGSDGTMEYNALEKKLVENIHQVEFGMGALYQLVFNGNNVKHNHDENSIYVKTLLKLIADEATHLLLLWTKFAEEIFNDCYGLELKNKSLLLDNDEDNEMLGPEDEDLKNLSPVWKVLICSSTPPSSRVASFEGGNMKDVLQHYVSGDSDGNYGSHQYAQSGSKSESLTVKVGGTSRICWPKNLSWLTLVSRNIMENNSKDCNISLPSAHTWELLTLINKQMSNMKGSPTNLFTTVLNGGRQIHQTLLTYLEKNFDSAYEDKTSSKRLLQPMRLLVSSIRFNPSFASILLHGDMSSTSSRKTKQSDKNDDNGIEKRSFPICDLILKFINRAALKLSDGSTDIADEDLAMASYGISCISILYEVCRHEISEVNTPNESYSTYHCLAALKYFLRDEKLFTDLLKILNIKPILLQGQNGQNNEIIIKTQEDDMSKGYLSDQSTFTSNRRMYALHLLSHTMKILSKELFMTMCSPSKSTSNSVKDGIKSYFQINTGERLVKSHHAFDIISSQFDSIKLAAEKFQALRNILEANGLTREFISATSGKHDIETNVFEMDLLMIIQRTIPRGGKSHRNLTAMWIDYTSTCKLAEIQAHFIESWRQFIRIAMHVLFSQNLSAPPSDIKTKLFSSVPEEGITDKNSGLVWSMSLVHHVISGLEKHCRSTNQAAILNTSPSYFRKNEAWLSTTYTAGKISSELLDVMLAALQDYVHCHSIHTSTYTEELRASLYDLMDTAGKIFTLLKSPQDRNIDLSSTPDNLLNAELEQRKKKGRMIGCHLRLQILTMGLLFLKVIDSSKLNDSAVVDDKKELNGRLALAELVCESLHLLKHVSSTTSKQNEVKKQPYEYDFVDTENIPLNLLRTCLAVLNSLLILHPSPSMTGLYTASHFRDLAATFRRWNMVSILLEHMSSASEVAVTSYTNLTSRFSSTMSTNDDDTVSISHENSLSVISSILELVNLASVSTSTIDVALLFMEDGVLTHSIIKNPLLQRAGQHWRNLSIAGNHDLRGYIVLAGGRIRSNNPQKHKNNMMLSSRQSRHDSVHAVWRLVLKTLTSLLGINGAENARFVESGIDFFCAYDGVILSSLYGGLEGNQASIVDQTSIDLKSTKPDQLSSNSRLLFTPNNLLESSASLSFLSELYRSPRFQQFESFSSSISHSHIFSTVRYTIRSFSTFLGSSGIARELFEAVSTLNRAMENASSPASPNRALMEQQIQHAFNINPVMIAGGVPNARHEAISHAHFAISCVCYVTPEDLAQSAKIIDGGKQEESSRENSLEGFHNHVNNEFSIRMERLAAKALYFAFSILSRSYPALSSFIPFESHEAERIDPTSFVKVGTVIALRPRKVSSFDPRQTLNVENTNSVPIYLRYAKVLRCQRDKKTWDVEYLSPLNSKIAQRGYRNDIECDVSFSRLAGLKDVTKKTKALAYSAAPKSPTAAYLSEISIGHLILALRWCKERIGNDQTCAYNDDDFIILKCLSERVALLLVTEMKFHNELGSDTQIGEDDVKALNAQLFELFGDITHDTGKEPRTPDGLLPRTPEQSSVKKTSFDKILRESTLKAISFHLEKQLAAARDVHAAMLRDRLGRKGTSPGPGSGRRRRSPFHGFGLAF